MLFPPVLAAAQVNRQGRNVRRRPGKFKTMSFWEPNKSRHLLATSFRHQEWTVC